MSFSSTFSEPYNNRPLPMPATLQATGHLTVEFSGKAAGTVIQPNPNLTEKGAMAERTRSTHSRVITWEELSDQRHLVSVSDDDGQELASGVSDDATNAVLKLWPYIVPPGTPGP